MLRVKLTNIKKVNEEGTHIVLSDATGEYGDIVYTPSEIVEDEYEASTNETGYGGINPLREDVANFIVGFYKSTKGDIDVEFEPYGFTSSMEFLAKAPVDGVYVFYMISVPLVETEDSPYYVNGKLLRVIEDEEVEIKPKDLINTQWCSPSISQFFVANNSKRKNSLNREKTLLIKENVAGRNDREIRRVQKLYDEVRGILSGAIFEYCRGNVTNAQLDIEFLNINTKC